MAFNLFPQTDFRQMDLNYVLEVSKQAAANLEEYAADKEQVVATQAAAEEALAAAQQDIQTATQAAASAGQDAQTATQAAGTATQAAADAEQDAQTASAAAATATAVQESIPADYTTLSNDVDNLKSDLNAAVETTEVWSPVELSLQNGYYYKGTGTFYPERDKLTAKINATVGDKYKLSTYIRSAAISGVVFFDSNNAEVSTLLDGTGTGQVITDYEFTVPSGIASMAVQSSDLVEATPTLSKYDDTIINFRAYTKEQADAKFAPIESGKYGLKWEIANTNDLGSRCFDAIGLNASIGVGNVSGNSDFDNIYPWSEIKRCNIKQNANGAKIITFEGEEGFALDGSNGDVFVRIPKFYYDHYTDNGFEYITVSKAGDKVHPAFVENGVTLDEIFVGAFEGCIQNNKLHSYAGVIPTSNEVGGTFLADAAANGSGYTIYDMRTSDALWALMAVEFGCRNSNHIIGYGYADFFQAVNNQYGIVSDSTATATNVFSVAKSVPQARVDYMPVGSNIVICKETMQNCITFAKLLERTSDTDHWYLRFNGSPVDLDTTCFIGSAGCTTNFCESAPTGGMTYHTGRANWITDSNIKNPVRYRWIENIVGSLWSIFPDITFNDLQMYSCANMDQYSIGAIDNGYMPIGALLPEQTDNGDKSDNTGVNYWVDELMNPYFGKGITFGKSWDTSLTSEKAFGAYYYLSSGRKIIANGGGFDHLYRCNMLTNRAWLATTDRWYLYGARLMYKPLA